MAKGYYETMYNSLFKGKNKLGIKKPPKTQEQLVQTKIDNYKTRLDAEGVDADKELDSRNFIEKALNLTPDQNFLFDIFELINRPQQALFGGIESAQQGESFWEGAGQGFTGNKDTEFKQILKNSASNDGGILNSIGVDLDDREGKIDLIDVLGFAGDVFLDPADLTLFPVSAGGKMIKTADTVSDVSKGVKSVDKLMDTMKAVDKVGGAAKGVKTADTVMDVAKLVDNPKQLKSLTSLTFEGIGKGIKGGAKLTDKSIEGVLKHLDSKGVKNLQDELVKLTYKNPLAENASKLGKTVENAKGLVGNIPKGRLETYKEVKDWFSKAFDSAKSLPKEVMETFKKGNADEVRAIGQLQGLRNDLGKTIKETAEKIAMEQGDTSPKAIKEISEMLNKDIMAVKEFLESGNRVGTVKDILEMAKDGTLRYSDEVVDMLKNIADDINLAERGLKLTIEVDDLGRVKLSKDWKKVGKRGYEDVIFDADKLNMETKLPTFYTGEQIEQLENLAKKYSTDTVYRELYEKADPIFNEANKIVDKNFGTKLAETYGDNAGYVRHAYNLDIDGLQKLGMGNDGNFRVKGNTLTLGERKYKMSAMEANNLFKENMSKNYDKLNDAQKAFVDNNSQLFSELYTESFDSYLRNIPKIAKDSSMINEILVKQTFGTWEESERIKKALEKAKKTGNTELVTQLEAKYNDIMDSVNMKKLTKKDQVVPAGFTRLTKDEAKNLSRKLDRIGKELGINDLQELSKTIIKNPSSYAIDDSILRLVGIDAKKEASALGRIYDRYLNFFKRNKVLSPTFQINNIIGNSSNMVLGGIDVTKQARLMPRANEIMNNASRLMEKVGREGYEALTTKEKNMYNIWNKFINSGFGDATMSLDLHDMPDSLKRYFISGKKPKGAKEILVDGLPYLNNKMNNYMDNVSRLSVFIEASENPSILKKLGVNTAGDAVKKVLFDPTELTEFERKYMKRIIPFYTFTKKNLAYHISNLGQNGEKYNRLMKGIEGLGNMATDGNYDNLADYIKENFYIPLPTLGPNGEYKVIRGNIPFGQVLGMAGDPLKEITSTLTPAIKAPIELALNKQVFNDAPIESFDKELSKNIPGLTKKQEFLLSNLTGLDTPIKSFSRLGTGDNLLEGALNAVTMEQNTNTDRLYKMYDELDKLETLMKQYKQVGTEFSTINELKKANRNKQVEDLMAKLNKINGIKKNY